MKKGVIKELSPEDRTYYRVNDVAIILGVSRSKAYDMIRTMRKECMAEGMLTKGYPAGRIPKRYFNKCCMIED